MSEVDNYASERSERYIIDMCQIAIPFKHEVMSIIVPETYYQSEDSSKEPWKHMLSTIEFIYQESIAQMFLILTTDFIDFASKLDVVLNMEYYNHIPVLVTHDGSVRFKKMFTSTALELAKYLMDNIPNDGKRADFLLEGLSDTYAVITKYYNN